MVHNGGQQLLNAARANYESEVQRLLRTGVDPNYQDENRYTALHKAAAQENGLGVLELLLGHKKTDVNIRNRNKQTPLILAARNGNYYAVQNLLKRKAKVGYQDRWRCNALDYATQVSHEDIVNVLKKAGARPTARKHIAKNSFRREVVPKDTAETMLTKVLVDPTVRITDDQLRNVLQGSKITDMRLFHSANYLIHMLKRMRHSAVKGFCDYRSSGGFVKLNLFYSVCRLPLNREETFMVKQLADYAAARELIGPESPADVKEMLNVYKNIGIQKEKYRKLTNDVLHELLKVDKRICKVEQMSTETRMEMKRLADNEKHVNRDMKRMLDFLNELHGALQRKERRDRYVGIARFLLSAIPIFGTMLGNATDAAYGAAEVFCGLTTESMVGIGTDMLKSGVSYGLGADLSDITSVRAVTSRPFLSNLAPKSRKRIEFIVQKSMFRGRENLRKDLKAVDDD
ncbi:ankyrin repeat domain containing protein [Gracilaria domingensis]|nr:ankyrin repeat domain containing protein [Gracilaria domingensis]